MKLIAENVESVFRDCLFQEGEDTSKAKIAEGIINKFGFHPGRLKSHKEEIADMLNDLPPEFREGWSFLNACMTKDGEQWGEHCNIEQLLTLGIATEQAKIQFPRSMWQVLPGGMPYFTVMVPSNPKL